MNWLQKLPRTTRAASGLEWTLWRKLPLIALIGTLLPLLGLGLVHLLADPQASAADVRWLQMVDYFCWAVIIFNWAMLLTLAIGCVIVMVMKGPGYVADGYKVSHSDRPREMQQTDEEAATARAYGADGRPE